MIISRHGCPNNVLSDQGSQFTSNIFKKLCQKFEINQFLASSYHQQTNGKVERFNRFLLQTLATVIDKNQQNWDQLIDRCLFIYRISLNKTLNNTPFFLIYGRDVVLPYDLVYSNNNEPTYKDINDYMDNLISKLNLNNHKANINLAIKNIMIGRIKM